MKYRPILTLGAAFLLLATGCGEKKVLAPADAQTSGKLEWLTDYETAKAQARAQNKTLLIDFTGSDWCPPCIALEKTVFSKPEFAAYATQHLVLLEVDFPRRKKLSAEQQAANENVAGQFGIEGFPTVVLLNASGKPLGAVGYYQDTTLKSFLGEIEDVRESGGADRP